MSMTFLFMRLWVSASVMNVSCDYKIISRFRLSCTTVDGAFKDASDVMEDSFRVKLLGYT